MSFCSKPHPGIFRNRVGRVSGSAKRAETTQEGPDITPATGKTPVPSASTNDTLVNSMANNGLGARTEVEDAITDQGVIVSQGENAEQSRMAGGGAGQHTTGATEPPGGMSSGDLSTWTRARKPDRARYKPGQGLTKVKGRTSTPGTPAATANHPTSESASGGIQKVNARFAVTVRGSDESRRGAHGTHLHICERHQPTDTVATNNHFRHVRGAKVRMECCSEEKAQQLSRTERAGSPEWRH